MASKPLDPRLVEVEFKNDFTQDEMKQWREWFLKYDKNKSGELELFELNVMYEELGTPKTHQQLKELIKDADTTNSGGIDYREFLAVILKDKKGIVKGPWTGFGAAIKVHDNSKAVGKKANYFEQEVAKQQKDPLEEEKRKIEKEDRLKAKQDKERKEKIQRGLQKLKEGINS